MPPGQEGTVTLKVKTERIRGAVSKTANVFSNDPINPRVTLTIKGNIKHLVDMIPQQIQIKAVKGETGEGKVMLVNNDSSPLEILDVESNSKDFTSSLNTIEKGKRYELVVKLNPKETGGRFSTIFKVHTNKEKSAELLVPVRATVSARVEAYPQSLDFSQIQLASVKTDPRQQYRLNRWFNIKGQEEGFQVTKVESSIPFVQTEVIPPKRDGQPYRIKVTLAEDKLKKGPFKGTITVRTNDKEFAELKVPLSGQIL